MTRKYVCGLKEPKKGEKRGSARTCADKNQVRYYGVVAIDPEILLNKSVRKRSLFALQLQYKKMQDDVVEIFNKDKKWKMIVDNKDATDKSKKSAQEKRKKLVEKAYLLKQKIKLQQKAIRAAEKEEASLKHASKKKSKTTSKKTSKTTSKKPSKKRSKKDY